MRRLSVAALVALLAHHAAAFLTSEVATLLPREFVTNLVDLSTRLPIRILEYNHSRVLYEYPLTFNEGPAYDEENNVFYFTNLMPSATFGNARGSHISHAVRIHNSPILLSPLPPHPPNTHTHTHARMSLCKT